LCFLDIKTITYIIQCVLSILSRLSETLYRYNPLKTDKFVPTYAVTVYMGWRYGSSHS